MLSGARLGITVTGLPVGYVTEPLVGRGLDDLGSSPRPVSPSQSHPARRSRGGHDRVANGTQVVETS
jgi:hypothetical protein